MGRILGLDFGERRIGLALSDLMHIIASPYGIIDRKITPDFVNEIDKMIFEKDIESLVVGLPITLSNKRSRQTKCVEEIIEQLRLKLKIPIFTIDERLSSVSAEKTLIKKGVKTGHNKEQIDKVAAAIFLQEFLDSK